MKQLLLSLIFLCAVPLAASATTLIGVVQYNDEEGRIGVKVNLSGKVARVHRDSPAEHAGLKAGDRIVAVDGERGAYQHIHGTPGTFVQLRVQRNTDELKFKVPRVDVKEINYHD